MGSYGKISRPTMTTPTQKKCAYPKNQQHRPIQTRCLKLVLKKPCLRSPIIRVELPKVKPSQHLSQPNLESLVSNQACEAI